MPDGFHFHRNNRVRLKSEFNIIFSRGKKFSGKYLYIYIAKNMQCPKIGFIVSKKGRNSVDRNHFKNQIRNIFRVNIYQLLNNSFVVGVKPGIKKLSYSKINEDFALILRRARCLKQ
ncbi:ribonuclease P protein component [Candidatus Calescamantes bacterium]|nr:ribonuclease P protein component [Candidatus Calescamantes bacterium]